MTKTYLSPTHMSYQYQSSGLKTVKISNNVNAINLINDSSNALSKQIVSISHLNTNLQSLQSNCFNGCTQVQNINIDGSNITTLQSNCFHNCNQLTSVTLTNKLQKLNTNTFNGCQLLNAVKFSRYTYDSTNDLQFALTSIDAQCIANCDKLTNIVLPESLSVVDNINGNAFNNSNLSKITFLGLTAADLSAKIKSTQCFGLNKSCQCITKDDKILKYSSTSNTITTAAFADDSEAVRVVNAAKRMYVGCFYQFQQSLIEYCMSEKLPFAVIYLDYKTDVTSYQFLQNVILNSDYRKACRDKTSGKKFFIFVLNRNGHIASSTDALDYYRTTFKNSVVKSSQTASNKSFVELSFYYDGKSNVTNFNSSNRQNFDTTLDTYAKMTSFDSWDSSKYIVKYDDPTLEVIPPAATNSSKLIADIKDPSTKATWSPWWFDATNKSKYQNTNIF